jgi:hypothetical protein
MEKREKGKKKPNQPTNQPTNPFIPFLWPAAAVGDRFVHPRIKGKKPERRATSLLSTCIRCSFFLPYVGFSPAPCRLVDVGGGAVV